MDCSQNGDEAWEYPGGRHSSLVSFSFLGTTFSIAPQSFSHQRRRKQVSMSLSALSDSNSSNGAREPLVELVSIVFDVPVVKPAILIAIKLGELVVEIRGSNQLCLDAIQHLRQIHSILEEMTSDTKIKHKQALEEYNALVKGFVDKLVEYTTLGSMDRLLKHFKLRDTVASFHNDLRRIKQKMGLEFQWELASNHQELVKLLESGSEKVIRALQESFTRSTEQIAEEVVAKLLFMGKFIVDPINPDCKPTKIETNAMRDAASILIKASNSQGLSISRWYTSRSNIVYNGEPHAKNGLRTSYIGTYNFGSRAFIQTVDTRGVEKDIRKRLNTTTSIWFQLKDPHVLPLYAGCNVGDPYLYAMELADCNFKQRFENSKRGFWRLFLDVARGLSYLHSEGVRVVHGNLKCSNLLVVNNTGVVSDFAFAYTKIKSSVSEKQQTPRLNWKAPECFEQGASANPRHESDVYSLGMCVFEAMAGEKPYEGDLDSVIAQKKRAGILPDRPEGKITDDAWDLIQHMCKREYRGDEDRWNLGDVRKRMRQLADKEAASEGM